MAALDVGGIDFGAAVMHKYVLVVVNSLFQVQFRFPVVGSGIIFEFGIFLNLPVGEFAKYVYAAIRDREIAFQRKAGQDIILTVLAGVVTVFPVAFALEGGSALIGPVGTGNVFQNNGKIGFPIIADGSDTIAIISKAFGRECAEFGAFCCPACRDALF